MQAHAPVLGYPRRRFRVRARPLAFVRLDPIAQSAPRFATVRSRGNAGSDGGGAASSATRGSSRASASGSSSARASTPVRSQYSSTLILLTFFALPCKSIRGRYTRSIPRFRLVPARNIAQDLPPHAHPGPFRSADPSLHRRLLPEPQGTKVKGEGNAASRLGLKPSTLRSRMQKLGIAKP
jgi:hypothetical protein